MCRLKSGPGKSYKWIAAFSRLCGETHVREDRLLLRRLRQGDEDALGRIYEKYKDALLTIAVSLVGDLSAAEDCLHDAFVAFAGNAADLPA